MRSHPLFRSLAAALSALLLAACATTDLPPIPAAGPGFRPLPDEVELWQEARAEEARLLAEAPVYDDAALTAYLEDVAARLTPPAMASNPLLSHRVTVLADPTLNAFSYPHGSLYVHTGLLARLANEDQLATVLGHEISHVEYRHMVRHRRAAANRAVGVGIAAFAALVVLTAAEIDAADEGKWVRAENLHFFAELVVDLGLQIAFVAAVNGYGRKLELEADRGGFRKLAAAGYRPAEASEMYETLLASTAGEAGRLETFFFGSHPRLTERIDSARRWAESGVAEEDAAADEGPAPAGDAERFARVLQPVLRDDARMNLERGRLDLAAADLERALGWDADDAEGRTLLGELRLLQAAATPAAEAEALRDDARRAFHEAIRLDPDLAEPHRELGLLLADDGDAAGACRELGHYLELAPDADDAAEIDDRRYELEEAGACALPAAPPPEAAGAVYIRE